MSAPFAELTWSQFELPVNLRSVSEADEWLDRIAASCNAAQPTIVTIRAHDHEVSIGLGLSKSIIQVSPATGDPPYFVTVGNADATDSVDYFLHGYHHTEVLSRHLIPTPLARQVVREFLQSGKRSSVVKWEEV